jgi:hypothetical protein
MRVYSMTINLQRDHRIPANFVFGRWWDIKSVESLDSLMAMLTRRTKRDKKGRVLCIGRVAYEMMSQKRLFVVKMGHDGILWEDFTALGQVVKIKLSPQV